MKIVAIVGSPRTAGNTSYLVDRSLQEAAAHGCETEKIMLSQYRVNPCAGHEDCSRFSACKQNDDAPGILEKFSRADGIILASPVYYYNMSAQMKAFVDRNYFLYTHDIPLKATCAGLIVIAGSDGIDQTARALRRFLKLASDIPDSRTVTLTGCATKPGEVKNNQALVEEARNLGKRLAEMLSTK